jgi:hypothetical protein
LLILISIDATFEELSRPLIIREIFWLDEHMGGQSAGVPSLLLFSFEGYKPSSDYTIAKPVMRLLA